MSFITRLMSPVDMTEGSPLKKIAAFAFPMLIGNIAQQLYSTVDSIVVGKFVGDNALAAVGASTPVIFLLSVLFIGIATGVSILVAQYAGARDREKLSYSIGSGITLSIAVSVFLMITGCTASGPLLRLMKTPESIFEWSRAYLMISCGGAIGSVLYNIFTGILRGLGDSFSALLYLLLACGLNVVLDLLLVRPMGVAGVALATILAQAVSAVFCFMKLRKMQDSFDLRWKYLKYAGNLTTDIVKLGIPSGLTQMIFSLSGLVVQSLTNSFGEMLIAANVIVMRIDGFAMMPIFSFGNTLTTFVGQNIGAKKYDRVKVGTKQGTVLSLGITTGIVVILLLFGKYVMRLFTNTEELIDMTAHCLRILALGYIANSVTQTLQGAMRGAGDTVSPMWISIVNTVVIRVPVAYLLAYLTKTPELPMGRYESLFWSMLIAWVIGMLLTVFAFARGRWRRTMENKITENNMNTEND